MEPLETASFVSLKVTTENEGPYIFTYTVHTHILHLSTRVYTPCMQSAPFLLMYACVMYWAHIYLNFLRYMHVYLKMVNKIKETPGGRTRLGYVVPEVYRLLGAFRCQHSSPLNSLNLLSKGRF